MGYKAEKLGKKLILAGRFYPSTQHGSNCGHVKTGDEKITLSENQNMIPNTMNMFDISVVMKMTVTTMRCSTY